MENKSLSSLELIEESKKEGAHTWNREQDAYLQRIVETYGNRDWNIIADNINNKYKSTQRTGKQCRIRWQKHIHPGLGKHHWTEKEEAQLLLAHQKYKNSWSEIAASLYGRSNNCIKNRFYTIFRKVRNKVKKADFTYSSKCEVLQIHYILSVMETYILNSGTQEFVNAKAGKDFIFKLVQHIDKGLFKNYMKKFSGISASFGSMQNLFRQLTTDSEIIEAPEIPLPENPPAEEEAKIEILKPIPSKPTPTELINPHSILVPKEQIFMGQNPKECSPLLENMVAGHITPQILQPCILSAGPAAAAAAASKALCFQASPDDLGFSEFTECARNFSEPIHWGDPKSVVSMFSPLYHGTAPQQMVPHPQVQNQQHSFYGR